MTQTVHRSTRLRAGVRLFAAREGYLLRVGDIHHRVRLEPDEAEALLDALILGGDPVVEAARAALESLIEARLVDPPPAHHNVIGDGVLADALRAALVRMEANVGPGGSPAVALDDDPALPPNGAPTCWISGDFILFAPTGVAAEDVVARRRAATAHRDTDPHTRPIPGGRTVTCSPTIPTAGLELAAATIAAELLRTDRSPYEAVMIDPRRLVVTRRPVLPVPPAPR